MSDEFLIKAMLRGGMKVSKMKDGRGWITDITNEPGEFWEHLPTEKEVERMWKKLK